MDDKIKILFYNPDVAGVNYFRTQTPAMELEKNHSDKFYVEINPNIDFSKPEYVDYLKEFHIIHYHRQLVPDLEVMKRLLPELKKEGIVLIADIDDYWNLHPKHPYYAVSKEKNTHIPIIENLKLADYVTTTTEVFATEIRKITGKDNVFVFENAVDPLLMKQFKDNRKADPDGRVRITYMAGSSHRVDIEQLEGVINILNGDNSIRDKFKIIIAGWDTEGSTTDYEFNTEFEVELKKINRWNHDVIRIINKTRGDVDAIPKLPDELRNRFRDNVFKANKRDIKSEESIYYYYENVLTDNHKIIENSDYINWLNNFERNSKYDNEGNFARRWTQKANIYAKVLDETDILLAPLADNDFNRMKSNLKQVECWTRKIPIVCSDIPPYNVDGKHMENCVLIPSKKHNTKYWVKYLKKLILDEELRNKLGEQLYDDFHVKYDLVNVTKRRSDFYNKVVIDELSID